MQRSSAKLKASGRARCITTSVRASSSRWITCEPSERTRRAVVGLASALVLATVLPQRAVNAQTADAVTGPSGRFGISCAGCHPAGGNTVNRKKTLSKSALDTNGYSKNSLISLIAYGNGKMPGFAEDCEPALQCTFAERLSKETIDDLAQYVLDEAEIDWQDWR